MKKKLYLCGPITGIRDYNKTAFNDAASALRGAGFDVFSPLENGIEITAPWQLRMRVNIAEMMQCSGLAVLRGAHDSRRSILEMHIATQIEMGPVRAIEYWLGD